MTTTIESLPTELLTEIIREASLGCWTGVKTLKSCTLVCKDWREPAERTLYGSLSFRNDKSAQAWLASTRRAHFPVKKLAMYRYIHSSLGCQVIAACPALAKLDVFGGNLLGWSSQPLVQSVKHLSVLLSYPFPPSETPLTVKLESQNISISSSYALDEHTISTILGSSADTFTTLSLSKFYGSTTDNITALLTKTPFLHLRTLDFYELTGSETSWTRLLCALPTLTTLKIRWIDFTAYALIGASATAKLETIAISGYNLDEATLEELLRVIRLPALQGLRHLEYPWHWDKAVLAGRAGLALLEVGGV